MCVSIFQFTYTKIQNANEIKSEDYIATEKLNNNMVCSN